MTQVSAPPSVPTAPAPPVVSQVIVGGTPMPAIFSRADIEALNARRSMLSSQLNSANGRRQELHNLLRRADGVDKAGLEARLAVLDTRIARLEGDIDENGKALSSIPALRAGARPDQGRSVVPSTFTENMVPIVIVFTIFVLMPLAVSIARSIWRRNSLPAASTSPEQVQRLERIEQAVDAIAIEMERVSEGQRFVTRLLSENKIGGLSSLGAGGAEPVGVPMRETVNVGGRPL